MYIDDGMLGVIFKKLNLIIAEIAEIKIEIEKLKDENKR